jgi:hypothetical protein
VLSATASTPRPTPLPGRGTHFATLTCGKKTFAEVTVRDVTVRSITFSHTGGIASLPLKELPPEIQGLFAYDPETERAAEEKLALARAANIERIAQAQAGRGDRGDEESLAKKFARLENDFRHPASLLPSVDLRPRFRQLTLGVKDQGLRPSCAIFAVVSALEFENAELTGKPEKLSEEYLLWATQSTMRRVGELEGREDLTGETGALAPDAGFSLAEVVATLRGFGIAPQSAMPNTFGSKIDDIPAPDAAVIEQARNRRRVSVHVIQGNNARLRIGNFVQALNAGVPVVLGLRWPHARTLRTGYLSQQKALPNYQHAVTLVGYRSESGELEDAVFTFKNSYGIDWGEAGYGHVTYGYLAENLLDAVVLEVRPGDKVR